MSDALASDAWSDPRHEQDLRLLLGVLEVSLEVPDHPKGDGAAYAGEGLELEAGARVGPFRIEALLGSGGMGRVFRAVDLRLQREVALKLILPWRMGDEAHQRRLLREAQAAAAVSHPNVAAVYEAGEASGYVYIALELVRGQTLRQRLGRGRLRREEAVQIALGLARALESIHARGFVHLDVKPENVLLPEDGGVKLLDFGLARRALPNVRASAAATVEVPTSAAASTLTASKGSGTPGYMAPEQAQGGQVDASADIYAFGVVLYELLAGRRYQPCSSEPPPRVRGPLAGVLARCLRPCPEERFTSGGALLEQIEAKLARARRLRRSWLAAGVLLSLLGFVSFGPLDWELSSRRQADPVPLRPLLGRSQRFTANPPERDVSFAALAVDGATVAYIEDGKLFLRPSDSTGAREVLLSVPGKLKLVQPGPGDSGFSVWMDEASGDGVAWELDPAGKVVRLLHRGRGAAHAIDGQGRRVAWVEEGVIRWRELPSGAPRAFAPVGVGEHIYALDWSPDGSWLAAMKVERDRTGATAAIEAWNLTTGQSLTLARSPRLIQVYGAGVFTWAPWGALVYATTGTPEGWTGSSLWELPFDSSSGQLGAAVERASFEGQSLGLIRCDARGRCLTLRYQSQEDVLLASLAPQTGAPPAIRRLTTSDFDERPAGWARDSSALYLLSRTEGLPTSLRLGILDQRVQDLSLRAPGRSLTWPVETRQGDLLAWSTVAKGGFETAFSLQRFTQATGEGVDLGIEVSETWSGNRPPPNSVRVRCGAEAELCVLGRRSDRALGFSTLDPRSGAERPLFEVPSGGTTSLPWDVSPDGSALVLIERGQWVIRDLRGEVRRAVPLASLDKVNSVSWACPGERLYASGLNEGLGVGRVVLLAEGSEHVLLESKVAWHGELSPSPDCRSVALLAKTMDSDLWLTQVQLDSTIASGGERR